MAKFTNKYRSDVKHIDVSNNALVQATEALGQLGSLQHVDLPDPPVIDLSDGKREELRKVLGGVQIIISSPAVMDDQVLCKPPFLVHLSFTNVEGGANVTMRVNKGDTLGDLADDNCYRIEALPVSLKDCSDGSFRQPHRYNDSLAFDDLPPGTYQLWWNESSTHDTDRETER
ncbi:MAG: hypothetical protein RIS36_1444 [Pseudomonadota bacterium]|jgi:hypothetical protein